MPGEPLDHHGANPASLRDPFGHVWAVLSWKEDINPTEVQWCGSLVLRAK